MIHRTTFNWLIYYDIDIIFAESGDKVKIGSLIHEVSPNLYGVSVFHIDPNGNTHFAIIFNTKSEYIPMETVAHECLHTFYYLLSYMNESVNNIDELNDELHVIAYEDLVHKTLQAIDRYMKKRKVLE